jgi:DNA gyrase subunit B
MNPATRRLIKVLPAGEVETERMFDTLLGDNLAERKRFIAVHGNEYINEADI